MTRMIEQSIITKVENENKKGMTIIKEMKEEFGHRAIPILLAVMGDGDWSKTAVFNNYRLTSVLKGAYHNKRKNIVMEQDFLDELCNRCWWRLTLDQIERHKKELLALFPERFEFVARWFPDI